MTDVRRAKDGMPSVAWICGACAEEHGGGWPKGHVASFHVGECGTCKRRRAVCSPTDYIWTGCAGGNCE